jgi:hypothetical protein
MKSKDQKELEMLYESIGEDFLIEEERIFIDNYSKYLAFNMVNEVAKYYNQIKTNPTDYFPCTMYNFFWSYLKEIPQDILAKLNLDEEMTDCFHDLYSTYIVKNMSHESIDVDKDIKTGAVCLIVTSPFNEEEQTIISLNDNLDVIASKLKECFKEFIRFTFTDKDVVKLLEKEEVKDTWVGKAYGWRKERAKVGKMENKLPELKGIF